MALGPVASLSAQVNQLNFQEESAQAMSLQMTGEENIQHSCCEDNQCHCTYQNECDIQSLSFFALKPQPSLLAVTRQTSAISIHIVTSEKYSPDKLYRPPIVTL